MAKQLSDCLDTTLRPLGTIPYASNQWPEARNFDRIFGHNPYDQARLVDTLVGLHQTALHYEAPTGITLPPKFPELDKKVAVRGIARTIWFVSSEHPEWRRKDYDIEPGWEVEGPQHYDADSELCNAVDAIFAGREPLDSGQRIAGFLRVHEGNPHAQANLLRTLLGMWKKPWEGFTDAAPSPSFRIRELSKTLSCRGIVQTVVYLATTFPEWSIDGYQPNCAIAEANEHPNYLEDRLRYIAERTLKKQENIALAIEDDQITLG